MRHNLYRCLRLLCLLYLGCGWAAARGEALEPVVLQLKWTHAFQFAGYYAAQELGYYREAGLDVDIRPARPGDDPVREVLEGRAQFGVGTSSLLLERKAGKPVVVLAVIFQHSPLVLIQRQDQPVQAIQNVAGKRVMIEPMSDELFAYLKQEGIDADDFTVVPHSYDPADLISGRVDAMSAYSTNEPYFLEQAGFAYQIHTPRSIGIDFYGDNLFTAAAQVRDHPERVRAFRAASLKGWAYAMRHPEQVIEMMRARYPAVPGADFLRFEARRMQPLMQTELVEVGYMNLGRWRHIADTYADLGLLPRDFSLQGFLYQTEAEPDRTPFFVALAIALVLGGIVLYTYRINRRLDQALAFSRMAQEELRQSEERHRLLADHATDVIWTMDLQGRFTYVSPSVEKLRGYTVAEVMAQSIDEALTPESAAIARAGLGRALQSVQSGGEFPEFRGELEQPCRDGSTVWTEVTTTGMRNGAGEFIGILGVTRDISERRQAEAQMRHMAQYDLLTDLPNRALFSDRLQQALAAAQRDRQMLALMFMDLDFFKPVNDTHGHGVGDLLLKEAAVRMQACLRASDTVARIGGDEFVVLLRTVEDGAAAVAVAEKILVALRQPFLLGELDLRISASIGIALYPEHGSDELTLSQRADEAMYWAKKHGHDRVCLYGPGLA